MYKLFLEFKLIMDIRESCRKYLIYRYLCGKSGFYFFVLFCEDVVYCGRSLVNLVWYFLDVGDLIFNLIWGFIKIFLN